MVSDNESPIQQIDTQNLFIDKVIESETISCIPRKSVDTSIFTISILLITVIYLIAIIIFRNNIKN